MCSSSSSSIILRSTVLLNVSGCDLTLRRGYWFGGCFLWRVDLICGFSGSVGFIRGSVADFLCLGTGGGCVGVAGSGGLVLRCGGVDACGCRGVDVCGCDSCVSWSGVVVACRLYRLEFVLNTGRDFALSTALRINIRANTHVHYHLMKGCKFVGLQVLIVMVTIYIVSNLYFASNILTFVS